MRRRKKQGRKRGQWIATVVLCVFMAAIIGGIAFFGKKILDGDSTKSQAYQENGYIGTPGANNGVTGEGNSLEEENQADGESAQAMVTAEPEVTGQEETEQTIPESTKEPAPEPTKAVQTPANIFTV